MCLLGVVQQCIGMDGVAMHGVGIDGAHKQNVSVENIKKCVRWAGDQAQNPSVELAQCVQGA